MNFQPDCPMERGGLAVLALGDPLSLLPLVAARFPLLSPTVTSSPGRGKSALSGGALSALIVRCIKAPPSGELASRSDD